MMNYLWMLLLAGIIALTAGCTTTNTTYLSVSDYPGTFVPTYYDDVDQELRDCK